MAPTASDDPQCAPNGLPQARHGHVAVDGGELVHGRIRVGKIGAKVDAAVAAAAAGDPDGARAAISVVSGVEPVRRSAHYLRGANGMILSLDTVTPVIQQQIAKGETPVLSEQEIRNYLSTGSIDG